MWRKVVRSGGQWLKLGHGSSNWAQSRKDAKVEGLWGDLAIWGNRFRRFRARLDRSELFRANESSRQLSGEGRRQGSSEDTRRVPRGAAAVRPPVLHHQHD